MKIQTTFILLGLLLAVAQGSGFINWAGSWDVETTESNDACYPDTTILIEQTAGKIKASWAWKKTQACTQAKVAGQSFTQTVDNPEDVEDSDLKLTVGGAAVGTFTVTKDKATFKGKDGASATYLRRFEFAYWTGTWDIVAQSGYCIPEKSITLSQSYSSVFAEWTWANSDACRKYNVAGERFVQNIDHYVGNYFKFSFKDPKDDVKVERMLTVVNNDQLIFSNAYGAIATFVRRQELVNWVGTWDFSYYSKSAGCYTKYATILPSGGNLVVSWTWDTDCQYYGLSGAFSQTVPAPKGGAISLNYFAKDKDQYQSGILQLEDDGKMTFTFHTGNYATFKRRPQMVNWVGAWEATTQDKPACYPESAIAVAQTSTGLTFSWVWAKTSPCTTLNLAGNKFDKTISTPAGNSVQLDVSTTLSVLFTVFHDGAVFSTNGATGGASAYSRKEENVKFAGTWNIQNQQAGSGCFPNTSVVITQDSGSLTAKWIWADSDQCGAAKLNGKEFTQSIPYPRGRAIFLDFIAGPAIISGIFTVNGDQATFASINEASATFTRKSSSTDPKNDTPTEPSTDPKNDTPTEPSKEPSTDSKNGSSSTGIIVMILIIALTVGGYFYFQKNRSKKLQEEDLNVSLSGIYDKP